VKAAAIGPGRWSTREIERGIDTMGIPGFTAEATHYKTNKQYSMGAASGYAYNTILPARGYAYNTILPRENSTCGSCSCDPGQCCSASGSSCSCQICSIEV